MLTPPVAKIGENSGQQVKIKIMPNKLPTNKESIFLSECSGYSTK